VPHDPERHHRRSMRWTGYDYAAAGMYFVTICTDQRLPLFGDDTDDGIALTEFGLLVHREWARSALVRPEIALDVFVVMPNHLHGLVIIAPPDSVGAHGRAPVPQDAAANPGPAVGATRAHGRAPLQRPPRSLGSFIAGFKATTTVQINELRGVPRTPVWQRGNHDRVVRNDEELVRIQDYIATNPLRWPADRDDPFAWALEGLTAVRP